MWASELVHTVALYPVHHIISELVQCTPAQPQRHLCPFPRATLAWKLEDFGGSFRQSRTEQWSVHHLVDEHRSHKPRLYPKRRRRQQCSQSYSEGSHNWAGLPVEPSLAAQGLWRLVTLSCRFLRGKVSSGFDLRWTWVALLFQNRG